tara:strand:+ start:1792 stop:18603 length:16812 start_codon:yes stop_codon:yes gene_type:complete
MEGLDGILSEKVDAIIADERYLALDEPGRSKLRNSIWDEEIEAGRMDELQRIGINGVLDSSSAYHREGHGDKSFIKDQYNIYKELLDGTKGADVATKSVLAQRFINQYTNSVEAEQMDNYDRADIQKELATISLGNRGEVQARRDKEGWFKGAVLGNLVDFFQNTAAEFGAGEEQVSPLVSWDAMFGGNEDHTSQMHRLAEEARERLRGKGLNDSKIEDLMRGFDHDTMDFGKDHTREVIRKSHSGEAIFNPEALMRMNSEEISVHINKAGLSEGAEQRALQRLSSEQADAQSSFLDMTVDPYFIDSVYEREGNMTERIDSYLTEVQGGWGTGGLGINPAKKFYTASVNNVTGAVTSMVGGTIGIAAGWTEGGREAAGFMESISGQLWETNSRLDQGIAGSWAAELVGLLPDLFIAKGAGTLAKSVVKLKKLKAISKARALRKPGARGGHVMASGRNNKQWLDFNDKMVKGGVALGSGYSAGVRVVNQALAQVDENGEQSFDYWDSVMFGFKQMLITGVVTRVGANTGMERFATGATMKAEARKFWKDYVAKDVLAEGLEESIDELLASIFVSKQMNPNMTTEEIVDGAIHAFILGGIMGGVTNFKTPWRALKGAFKSPDSVVPKTANLAHTTLNLSPHDGASVDGTTHDGAAVPGGSADLSGNASPHDGVVDPSGNASMHDGAVDPAEQASMHDGAALTPKTSAALASLSPELYGEKETELGESPLGNATMAEAAVMRGEDPELKRRQDKVGQMRRNENPTAIFKKASATPASTDGKPYTMEDARQQAEENAKWNAENVDAAMERMSVRSIGTLQAKYGSSGGGGVDPGKSGEGWDGHLPSPSPDQKPTPASQTSPTPQTTPTPQAGPTPTPKTQPAPTKLPVKREVDPITGEVDIGEGVKIDMSPGAPSPAQQVFGDPASSKRPVTGKVHIDSLSVKRGKDGKNRVYIDDQVTDQVVRPDGGFETDMKSTSTLTAESFFAGRSAKAGKGSTPSVESTQDSNESSAETKEAVQSPSDQFISDGKGNQKESRAKLVGGKGRADLDTLAEGSPVESVEDAPRGGQYNPVTEKVEIDPNQSKPATFREVTLPRINAEKASLKGDGKVDAITKAVDQKVVDNVLGSRPDLSPEQRTKLFIVEALMGNKEAQAELLKISKTPGVESEIRVVLEDIARAEKGQNSQTVLLRQIKKMAKRFKTTTNVDIGTGFQMNPVVNLERRGVTRVSRVVFNALKVLRKDKSDHAAVDSGKPNEENKVSGVLAIGSIIEVKKRDGDAAVERWKVIGHHHIDGGEIRMELRKLKMTKEGIKAELGKLHRSATIEKAMHSAMAKFRKLDRKNHDLTESMAILRKLVEEALSEIAGKDYTNSKLRFKTGAEAKGTLLENRLMYASGEFDENGKFVDSKIYINEELLHLHIHNWSNTTDGSNSQADLSATKDIVDQLNLMLFEEVAHDHALQKMDQAEIAAMTRDWIEVARKDGYARGELLRWRAYQLGNLNANPEEQQKMWTDLLDLADKAETKPKASEGVTLEEATEIQSAASEELNDVALQVGHEALAGFVQLIKIGATTHDMESMSYRWMPWLKHESASPKKAMEHTGLRLPGQQAKRVADTVKAGETVTVIQRLLEMASRAFEAVQNYMKVHRTINALPPSVGRLVDRLEATLDYSKELGVSSQGIKAPDPFSVQQRALEQGRNNINQNKELIEADEGDLFDAQQELRDVLKKVNALHGTKTGQVIRLEWQDDNTAALVIRSEIEGVLEDAEEAKKAKKAKRAEESEESEESGEDLLNKLNQALTRINESGRPTAIAKNAANIHAIQLVMRRLGITQNELVGSDAETKSRTISRAVGVAQERVANSLGLNVPDLVEAMSEAHKSAVDEDFKRRLEAIPDFERSIGWGDELSDDEGTLRISRDEEGYRWEQFDKAGLKIDSGSGVQRDALPKDMDSALQAKLNALIRGYEHYGDEGGEIAKAERAIAEIRNRPDWHTGKHLDEMIEAEWDLHVMMQDARGLRPSTPTIFTDLEDGDSELSGSEEDALIAAKESFKDNRGKSKPGDFIPDTSGPFHANENVRHAVETRETRADMYFAAIAKLHEDKPSAGFLTFGQMLQTFKRDQIRAKKSQVNPFKDALKSKLSVTTVSRGRPDGYVPSVFMPDEDAPVTHEQGTRLLGDEGRIDEAKAEKEIEEAIVLIETVQALQEVEEEMNYALLGGLPPKRVSQNTGDSEWVNINLSGPNKDVSIPADLSRIIRTGLTQLLEETQEGVDAQLEDDDTGSSLEERNKSAFLGRVVVKKNEREGERIRRVVELSDVVKNKEATKEEKEAARLEFFELIESMKSLGLKVQFEDGRGQVVGVTYEESLPNEILKHAGNSEESLKKLVNELSKVLLAAERASNSLVGLDADLLETNRAAIESTKVRVDMKSNARAAAAKLARQLITRIQQGDSKLKPGVRVTGGFPFEVDSDTTWNEDGEKIITSRLIARDQWFDIPQSENLKVNPTVKYDANESMLALIGDGTIADTLLEVASRLDTMESPSTVSDQGVLSHEYGLTPAGFVHQLVANPFTALLVRMKGTKLKHRSTKSSIAETSIVDLLVESLIAAGDADSLLKAERIKALFASLPPGIENDAMWKPTQGAGKVFRGFTDLRRLLIAGNSAYSQTMSSLKGHWVERQINRDSKTSDDLLGEDGLTLAIDYKLGVQMDWNNKIAAEERRRHEDEKATSILSLIVPDRAYELLRLFDRRSPQSAQKRITQAVEGGKESILLETENKSENLNARTIEDTEQKGEASIDYELTQEQKERNKLASLRMVALMELNGGSLENVLRILDSEEYSDRIILDNGDVIYSYHWDKIDSAIISQLTELAEKESELGVVTFHSQKDGRPTDRTVDTRLKKMIEEKGREDPEVASRPDFEGMPPMGLESGEAAHVSRHMAYFNAEAGGKPADLNGFDQDNLDSWARFLGVTANLGLNPDAPKSAKGFVEAPLSDIGDLRDRVSKAYDEYRAGRTTMNRAGRALTAVLQTQGRALPNLRSDDVSSEMVGVDGLEPGHSATAWSVMTTLSSQIPGLTIIKGDVSDLSDEGDMIPSVAFVGTEDDPVLVFPFRYWSMTKGEDVHRVTKEMIAYIAKRNGTDIVNVAKGLLQPLMDAHNGDAGDRLKNHLVSTMTESSQKLRGEGLSIKEENQVIGAARTIWLQIKAIIEEEIVGIGDGSGGILSKVWGDPARAEGAMADMSGETDDGGSTDEAIDMAADIVATFLTSDPMKRILSMSSIGLKSPGYPNHPYHASMGSLMRADLLATQIDQNVSRQQAEAATEVDSVYVDQSVISELLSSWESNYDEGLSTADSTDDAEGGVRDDGGNAGLDSFGVWRVLPHGQEQAENLLMSSLIDLDRDFKNPPTGLQKKLDVERGGDEKQLTEYEALQLLALFSDEEIAEIGRNLKDEKGESAPMKLGVLPQTFTVPELQQWNAQAAGILRQRFKSVSRTHDSSQGYDIFERWGAISGTDYIEGGNTLETRRRANRVDSGRYAYAKALGMFSEEMGVEILDVRGWDKETLRDNLEEAGVTTLIPNVQARHMKYFAFIRAKVLEEDPSLAGDALYEAISNYRHKGTEMFPEGSISLDEIGTPTVRPRVIERMLREFDAMEDVEMIDIVDRAFRRMEVKNKIKEDHLEEFRNLVLENTSRDKLLTDLEERLKEARQDILDAPGAGAFWEMLRQGGAWDALSKLPGAKKTMRATVNSFWEGSDEFLDALANHLIGLDEAGRIGVGAVRMGEVTSGQEMTRTTQTLERGYKGTDRKLDEVGETYGPGPHGRALPPPAKGKRYEADRVPEDYTLPKPASLPGKPEMLRMQVTTPRGETWSRGSTEVVLLSDLVSQRESPIFKAKQARMRDQMEQFERDHKVTPDGAVVEIEDLLNEHDRVQNGTEGRRKNVDLLIRIETRALELSAALDDWVNATTALADAEFGVGVLSRVTQLRRHNSIPSFPRLRKGVASSQFSLLVSAMRNRSIERNVSQFQADAGLAMDPAKLVQRIQNHNISQSLQAFIDSPKRSSDPTLGDMSGNTDTDSREGTLARDAKGAGIPLDLTFLQKILRDSLGKDDRVEIITEALRVKMSKDIDPLFRRLGADVQHEVSKLKQEFIREKGEVPHLLDALEKTPLGSDLTRDEHMDAQIRALEAAIALDRQVTEEELITMANAEKRNVIRARSLKDEISTFRDDANRKVEIRGSAEEVELTQRVLTDLAETHSRLYEENLEADTENEGLDRSKSAAELADAQIVAMEKLRLALGAESGQEYSVVGDLLVPENATERLNRILGREDAAKKKRWRPKAFDPKSIRFTKLKRKLELYASSGHLDDRADFGGDNAKGDRNISDEDYDKEHRDLAMTVFENFENRSALVYGILTPEQEAAGKKHFKSDHLQNAKDMKIEMFIYMTKFAEWIDQMEDYAMGTNQDVVNAFAAHKRRVKEFMEKTGVTASLKYNADLAEYKVDHANWKAGGEIGKPPEKVAQVKMSDISVSAATVSELMTHYAEAKALTMGRLNEGVLEAGFVNAKVLHHTKLMDKVFKSLIHTDAKIRMLFARNRGAQGIAQRIGGILDYGLAIKGGATGGREGWKGMVDDLQTAIAYIAPKRKKIIGRAVKGSTGEKRGWSETTDYERASEGYVGQMIISKLSEGSSVRDQAQLLLEMFDATDASFKSAEEKGVIARRFGKNKKALDDRDIYELDREKFYGKLEILAGRTENTTFKDAKALIQEGMDEDAIAYGEKLSDLMGYMMVVYQAQSSVIPKSELLGPTDPKEKHSFEDGNTRLLPMANDKENGQQGGMPSRWQRVFVGQRKTRGSATLLSEDISMRGAEFLKNPKSGMEDKQKGMNVLDVNGIGAPLGLLDDMAYRMNVSPAFALSQEFTGASKRIEGGDQMEFIDDKTPDYKGYLGTYYVGDKTRSKYNPDADLQERYEDIAVSLSTLTQDIIKNDKLHLAPRTATQDFIEATNIVGMASALVSFRQWGFQTLPAIMGYSMFRGGFGKNVGVIPMFFDQSVGTLMGLLPMTESFREEYMWKRKRNKDVGRFLEEHSRGIHLRTADGQVEAQSHLHGASARVRNRTAVFSRGGGGLHGLEKNVLNYMFAIGKGVSDGTIGASTAMLRLTIAKAEKVAIQSIMMNEIIKGVQAEVDKLGRGHKYPTKVIMKDVLAGTYNEFLTADIMEPARIIAIDILAHSDTSKKGSAFQREDSVAGEMLRGIVVTFGNHLLSTSANSHAAAHMMWHGRKEKEDLTRVKKKWVNYRGSLPKKVVVHESNEKGAKPVMETVQQRRSAREGAALMATNVSQNVAYRLMDLGFMSHIITQGLAALGASQFGWDEEEEEERAKGWLMALYGFEDGVEGRYDTFQGWATRLAAGSRRPWGYNHKDGEFSEDQLLTDKTTLGTNIVGEVINQTPFIGLLTSTTAGGTVRDVVVKDFLAGLVYDLPVFGGKRAGLALGEGEDSGQGSEKKFDRFVYWLSYFSANYLGDRNYFFMGLNHMAQPFYNASNAEKESTLMTKLMMMAPAAFPATPRDLRQELYEEGVPIPYLKDEDGERVKIGGYGNEFDVKGWHDDHKAERAKKKRKQKGGNAGWGAGEFG